MKYCVSRATKYGIRAKTIHMDNKDERSRVTSAMFATLRRIQEIEHTALEKIGKYRSDDDRHTCSFCGKDENQAGLLIEGSGNARICMACVAMIDENSKDEGSR